MAAPRNACKAMEKKDSPSRASGQIAADVPGSLAGKAGTQPFNSAKRASTSRLPMWRSEATAFKASALGLDFPVSQA